MNDAVRQTLSEMMSGPTRDRMLELRRFEGMLKDLCPGDRAEAHVLLCGLKANLPQKLMKPETYGNLESMLTKLVEEMGERYALEPDAAGWAVEAWAVALGAMPEEEAGQRAWSDGGEEEEAAYENPARLGKRSPSDSWQPGSYVTVASDEKDNGDFSSLRAALEDLDPGMKILLKPGIYRESLEIQNNVEIAGDGDATEVIIESIRDTTMGVACRELQLTNLTLRAMTSQMTSGVYALQVAEGLVRAKNCRFASAGDTAVIAYGQGTNLLFNQCVVGDGPGLGMSFMDLAKGKITESEIFGQAAGCVSIRQWASPNFQRCRIHGSQVAGIMVSDYGVGSFVDCDIFDHWLSGVTITTGGNPTLERCRIHGARANGIWIAEKGEGTVRGCEIHGNARGPIFVETGCRPKILNNQAPT